MFRRPPEPTLLPYAPLSRSSLNGYPAGARPARGKGGPIGADRSGRALVGCHRHESLLNVAFADTPGFWLRCPYDGAAVAPAVLEDAHRTHPVVVEDGACRASEIGRASCRERV